MRGGLAGHRPSPRGRGVLKASLRNSQDACFCSYQKRKRRNKTHHPSSEQCRNRGITRSLAASTSFTKQLMHCVQMLTPLLCHCNWPLLASECNDLSIQLLQWCCRVFCMHNHSICWCVCVQQSRNGNMLLCGVYRYSQAPQRAFYSVAGV